MSLTATLWDMESTDEPVGTVTVTNGQLVTTGDIPDEFLTLPIFLEDGQVVTPDDGDLWVTEWARRFQFLYYATVE